jgi:hypothetical protein
VRTVARVVLLITVAFGWLACLLLPVSLTAVVNLGTNKPRWEAKKRERRPWFSGNRGLLRVACVWCSGEAGWKGGGVRHASVWVVWCGGEPRILRFAGTNAATRKGASIAARPSPLLSPLRRAWLSPSDLGLTRACGRGRPRCLCAPRAEASEGLDVFGGCSR